MKRFLILLLLSFSLHAQTITANKKYDSEFRAWSSVYLPGRDWQLLKAQCWQESRLKENAKSYVGAMGVCQFMPGTWNEVTKQTGFIGSPWDAELNISMAAYYMSVKLNEWTIIESDLERNKHAIASYNAGTGNTRNAWRRCAKPATWDKSKACLIQVTGKHSRETIDYVEAIYKFYKILLII